MADYKIITDSTTDLSMELVSQMEVDIVPLVYNVESNEYYNYLDERGLKPKEFYDSLRSGKTAGTSAVNTSYFVDVLEPYLQKGVDILYAGFSSALSGTYNNGVAAVAELAKKYPDRKILTVDTLSASMGEGLLVYLATLEKKKGKTIEEVYQFLLDNRLHLCHWFTVDDLNHLKRGGRVSATAALLGTVLGIKPILHVDNEGRLIPVGKARGRRQSLEVLITKMAETGVNLDGQTVFISHGDSIDDARYVESVIREKFDVKNVYINYIGPVIGAHSGPGTIALFFLGTIR